MRCSLQGNEEQIGGFDLIYKEKPKARERPFAQRISFLGTLNNRLDNLKKLAKANAPRLNEQYDLRRQQEEKKRVMSSANSNSCHEASKGNEASKSSNGSKRNITNRKYLPIQPTTKVLANNNTSLNVPKKDFVIKNKVKREYTNEN